jgi:hypothetical protein
VLFFEENSALQTLGDEHTNADRYYYGAFQGCTSLQSIEIPDSVTSTGDATFKDCSALETVHLPNSLTKVRQYAFSGCFGLTSIAISDSVTRIGERAFYNCKGLTSITILDGVTSIITLSAFPVIFVCFMYGNHTIGTCVSCRQYSGNKYSW